MSLKAVELRAAFEAARENISAAMERLYQTSLDTLDPDFADQLEVLALQHKTKVN